MEGLPFSAISSQFAAERSTILRACASILDFFIYNESLLRETSGMNRCETQCWKLQVRAASPVYYNSDVPRPQDNPTMTPTP